MELADRAQFALSQPEQMDLLPGRIPGNCEYGSELRCRNESTVRT